MQCKQWISRLRFHLYSFSHLHFSFFKLPHSSLAYKKNKQKKNYTGYRCRLLSGTSCKENLAECGSFNYNSRVVTVLFSCANNMLNRLEIGRIEKCVILPTFWVARHHSGWLVARKTQMDISQNICMHQLLKSQHTLSVVCHFILTRLYLSAHASWKAERAKDVKDGLCSSCKMHLKPVMNCPERRKQICRIFAILCQDFKKIILFS